MKIIALFITLIRDNRAIVSVLTLILITAASLWPSESLPSVPGTDKTHHVIAYAILMFPAALDKSNRWVFWCLVFIAYGGMIELIQPYVNRYGEWPDMAANSIGIICGLICGRLANYLFPAGSQVFKKGKACKKF